MEPFINEEVKKQVRGVFSQLKEPVEVLFFGQKADCELCDQTRQLVSEVTDLSDLIQFSEYDLASDQELAQTYHVDKVPALVIAGVHDEAGQNGDRRMDYGVRYAGIPSGHEFTSLIHDLVLVSRRDSGLSQQTREVLGKLSKPVTLQVFVTPTCPYCPRAVVLAHQMALESPFVQAEMVEATEFPELSNRYGVSGVPQTTINDGAGVVVGAVPEEHLLAEILQAVNGN